MNPCRCGHLAIRRWRAAAHRAARRLPGQGVGPFLDRVDLHAKSASVIGGRPHPPPPPKAACSANASATARAIHSRRFDGSSVRTNAEADGDCLDSIATPD